MTTIDSAAPAAVKFIGRDAIVDALDRHHVPYESWGTKSPFGLGHLIAGLDTEQMVLKEVDGELLLEVQSVRVIPQYWLNGNLMELYESHWKWPLSNPAKIERNFRGISKTKSRDESALDTAHLALAVEPGFSEEGFRNPSNYTLEAKDPQQTWTPQNSDKWDGLDANYHWDVFYCPISEKIFRSEGYFMVKWERSTHYVWKPV